VALALARCERALLAALLLGSLLFALRPVVVERGLLEHFVVSYDVYLLFLLRFLEPLAHQAVVVLIKSLGSNLALGDDAALEPCTGSCSAGAR